ncbi:MAG: S8 family serine peptidase, partial [Caldilineaceae bacterium]
MSKPSASQQAATLNSSNEAQVNASVEATAQQEPVVQWILSRDPSAKILGRLRVALNAVIVETDAALLGELALRPGVTMINPVGTYELDLSETVPHIGAAAVQAQGFDGTGVVVAVLDSGIDYTHRNLGGEGTFAAYEAAYADFDDEFNIITPRFTTRDGLFPTPKVIDGMDFVGESWPNAPEATDEDPIDFEGHGTHVADIIAGASTDGLHKGVAPGASLVAVKVCSAVSSSCSGLALLLGVEFSLDRNGDGSTLDAVDVMNLSLGSNYGQIQDDLSFALANAVKAGVVVVASAGNGSDRPYVTGSPSSTPEVISVAQTSVPSDSLFVIELDTVVLPGVGLLWQPWSAPPVLTSGVLQYGNGANGNLRACVPYPAGSLAGKTLLVDRGDCAISIKVSNGAAAGAVAVIIANNAAQGPGEPPPSFSFGGGNPNVPGYTVTRT